VHARQVRLSVGTLTAQSHGEYGTSITNMATAIEITQRGVSHQHTLLQW